MHDQTAAAASLLAAKIGGAVIGSAISLAYVFPQGRREAALRFFTGLAGGLVFGTTVGVTLAHDLGIESLLSEGETVLMGSGVASLALWWVMGLLLRLAQIDPDAKHEKRKAESDDKDEGDNDTEAQS
ncbi:MAG: DUF6107 family protein [Pseudomonadota bacterium]